MGLILKHPFALFRYAVLSCAFLSHLSLGGSNFEIGVGITIKLIYQTAVTEIALPVGYPFFFFFKLIFLPSTTVPGQLLLLLFIVNFTL